MANKYHAKIFIVDGIRFSSKKEGLRFRELSQLERAGKITGLERQKKYILIPAQREPDTVGKRGGIKPGKLLEREVAYYADFDYLDQNGKHVVEDTKGIRTKDYIIKRKLMLWVHGIRIKEL